MSAEQNKAIARRVYEIVTTGDFGRAEEIVDQDAPDNELLPDDPPAKLIDTFKETFTEARAGFPDLSITVEDVMAEGDLVAARVVMRGTHQGEFQGLAPTGKRVEVKAIDMFRISNGKIVEHWGHADDPTGFLRQSRCS
jgi:predicted ester cyclase